MKKVYILILSVAVFAICAACGGADEAIAAQQGFADKACACADIECVKGVQEEQNAWVAEHGGAAIVSEDDAAKLEEINKKLTECVTKVVQKAQAGQ